MKSFRILISTLILGAVVLAACGPQTVVETVEVEREVEVTRQVEVEREVAVTPTPIGGELVLYACLFEPDRLQVIFETFKRETGVSATCLDMSSGEALQRIRAEDGNPEGDVLFGTTNLSHVNLAAEGLLHAYQGDGWSQLPEGSIKDPDGYWTGFYYGVIGFACNPERLEEIGAECPGSWDDLLDPAYQGEIVIASPAASGTSYTVLSGLAQLMGEDEAFAWYEQFAPNVAQFTESGSAPGKMAARGEFAIGISFAHDIQVQQQAGLPVEISFPEEGTPFEIGGISVLEGADNVAAAEAWVDYVFTPAFQRYHNDVANRIPVVDGVQLSETAIGLEDVKLIEGYDPTDWAAERDRLVGRWQDEIGAAR